MLIARSMRNQEHGYVANLEKQKGELEKEVERLKISLNASEQNLVDEVKLREKAQWETMKAKTELAAATEKTEAAIQKLTNLRKNFVDWRRFQVGELTRACGAISRMVSGVGGESELPADLSLKDLTKWLATEMEGLEATINAGKEHICMEALRDFAHSLKIGGCNHIENVPALDLLTYWRGDPEEWSFACKFFDDYWLSCGRDLPILRAALTGLEVSVSI